MPRTGSKKPPIVASKSALIEEAVTRSIAASYPTRDAFANLLRSKKRARIYYGVDPSGEQLHLGHLVNLLILKRFQALGHEIIILIGDFTAQIGDPTDKLAARQPLTAAEVKKNFRTFKSQASRIVKFTGKNAAKVVFNSKWLGKLSFADVTRLAQHVTVQQLIERDMFQERLKAGKPIGMHEFLYPLMQGYDSVAMKVDLELGGTDQTFNMLMGRTLERIYLNKEKVVVAAKLLSDPKTGKKMSKSEGSFVALEDRPEEVFGKVMAMEDSIMFILGETCTEMPLRELAALEREVSAGREHPRDAKLAIAGWVVRTIRGELEAKVARNHFEAMFMKRETEGVAPNLAVHGAPALLDLVMLTGVASSRTAAQRLIAQGAVAIGATAIKDPKEHPSLQTGDVLKVGKRRYFRIVLR